MFPDPHLPHRRPSVITDPEELAEPKRRRPHWLGLVAILVVALIVATTFGRLVATGMCIITKDVCTATTLPRATQSHL